MTVLRRGFAPATAGVYADRRVERGGEAAAPLGSAVRSSLRDLIQIGMIGFAVTFVYCGCDWRAEPSFVAWAQTLPAGAGRDALVWLSEHLRIFSNAGEGLIRQVKHN
ncbi:MAG: hypothetical protein ACREHD_03000, partial [Pirellulales bacterium]